MKFDLRAGSIEAITESDAYIPLNIRFGEEDFELDRKGIYGPNGELFEMAVSLSSNEIKELTLVHCESFCKLDRALLAPAAKPGIVSCEIPDHFDASKFDVYVYSDGLRILFAEKAVETYLRQGDAIFGINESLNIISEMLLCNITSEDIATMIETIESTASQKDAVIVYDGEDEG